MKKLPLCKSLGCVAKIKKCTDTCLAAHGCPDELHDYFETPIEMIEDLRKQFKPVPIEPCTDHKWSEAEIHEIADGAFRRALDKRLSSPVLTCLLCNDSGIVDGEFDGALECACKKGTDQYE